MTRRETARALELSRREFLVTTGGALVGLSAFGLVDLATGGKRHPQRDGIPCNLTRAAISPASTRIGII